MPAFTRISPTSRESTTSRSARNMGRPFCAKTTTWALSIRPTIRPCVDVNGNPLPGYADPSAVRRCGCQCPESRLPILFLRPTISPAVAVYYSLLRPHRREGTGALHRRPDQGRQLDLQPRPARRTSITVSLLLTKPNRASGLPTTSSRPAPCCASPMRAPWKRPSTRTWCSRARAARTRCWRRCFSARPAFREFCIPVSATSFMPAFSRPSARHVVVSGEYIWKYTHNAFDFSVLGNTPITFPIDWHNSKIPGLCASRGCSGNFHDFSAYVVMSSVAARFFPPQVAGAGATVGQTGSALPHRPRREVQPDHASSIHLSHAQRC